MSRLVWIFAAAIATLHAQDPQRERMQAMQAMTRALGVDCIFCHTGQDWKAATKPEYAFSVRMIHMTDGLSAGTLRNLGGITCWTCHRGNRKPARMPRAGWEGLLAKWPESLKLSEADAKKSRREVYKNIRSAPEAPAGSLAMSMSVFAAALGVGCDHCHVPGRWESDEKQAKLTARLMLGMFEEIPRYFDSNRQPMMQCFTCHQGAVKPERRPKD